LEEIGEISKAIWDVGYSFDMAFGDDPYVEFEKELEKKDKIIAFEQKAA